MAGVGLLLRQGGTLGTLDVDRGLLQHGEDASQLELEEIMGQLLHGNTCVKILGRDGGPMAETGGGLAEVGSGVLFYLLQHPQLKPLRAFKEGHKHDDRDEANDIHNSV